VPKKPPTDDGKEGVEKLRSAERVRYKMKLAKGLEALPRREREIELKRLQPLLRSIAASATFLYDTLKKPANITLGDKKPSNVVHIAPWVAVKSKAVAIKPHKTLWAYLADCKDLLEAFMPLVKANLVELKTNMALVKHFQGMFNTFLTETGTLQVVNELISLIEGPDGEPPPSLLGA
jgi:hypothetical protein